MNIVFHYYTTYFLAKRAGFNRREARIIAHSSQFVDSNIITYEIDTNRGPYTSVPTQNYGFWSKAFPRDTYLPFHFIPGDTGYELAVRKDKKRNPLSCTPNSPRSKEILIAGLKSRNPYRIGIAIHSYADTWAHQNFSGLLEDWNIVDRSLLIPSIGHAQALKKPDVFTGTWRDPRVVAESISNYQRFMNAAERIYRYLATYNRRPFKDWELVAWELEEIVGREKEQKSEREIVYDFQIKEDIERYDRSEWLKEAFDLIEDPSDDSLFAGYDKFLWLKDAFMYRTSLSERARHKAKGAFYESHFYQWMEASKEHRSSASAVLKDLRKNSA